MAEIVVDIHSICSADGWYFSDYGGIDPVLCLALVSTMDTNHPSLAPARQIIALDKDYFGDILGMTIESKHTDIGRRDPDAA